MTPCRRFAWVVALAALTTGGGSARAAWNNVFQVCCHNCRGSTSNASPVVAVPAAPAACPPQQQCTTRYVQRSYYQPVTSYQQKTYYEPVTTYRTSYYYEPVTSYRYSCYYDPCSCSYQQVATPTTSYRLRSQCSPVTSYLQRCMMQPVTSYQLSYYYEPQTTCCQTTIGAPIAAPPAGAVSAPAPPAAPIVGEERQPGLAVPPGVSEGREASPSSTDTLKLNPYPAPPSPTMPRAPEGATFRPSPGYSPATPVRTPPPAVRLDRIVAIPAPNIQGEVVSQDRRAVAGARLLFVHADLQNTKVSATVDEAGRFRATLGSGSWLVYVQRDDKTEYRQRIEVKDDEPTLVKLVGR